jgi:dipeptidyl aminopeptidase/acylaminoacyl peptidase
MPQQEDDRRTAPPPDSPAQHPIAPADHQADDSPPPPQPFTVEDLYLHQKITEIECSAAAGMAVCSVTSVDREKDGYVSSLWLYALEGNHTLQLTRGSGKDNSPRWSPDGQQVAFLSDRAGGSPQVHVIGHRGGEARQVSRLPSSVTNLQWMPDGRQLLVAAAVTVDPDQRGARTAAPPPPRGSSAPEVAWKLPYKEDGIGYLLQREIHLFSVDAESGEHRQLTDGAFDVVAFDVSADGRQIAYARTRGGRFSHRYDLWRCDASGDHAVQLTEGHAIVMQPTWSPDGHYIAFTGAIEEGDAEPALWLYDCAQQRARRLGDVDVADPTSLHWAADSRSLVFCRAHRGCHQVVRIDIADPQQLDVLLGGDRQLGAFGCTGDRMAFAAEHPSLASELRTAAIDGRGERQVSDLNAWWRQRPPIEAEIRTFEVPDGQGGTESIEGWLLRGRSSGADKGPGPLLNDIHGGPAAYALMDFDTNVFWQVLCASGWSVLALNAVGSASYGHEFCRRLSGHWGEYDLPQHLAAIAQLQAEGVCDDRVAMSGKSYGGYLSAWGTGHTDVFRAAVVMAPVGNIETHYGTSDGGYYADPYYLATQPRFDRERARALSPLQHIEKSRTPTLFLQGKEDERCPKCQSEELFVSLLRAGDTPAELVLYPGETHSFLGAGAPSCRRDAAARIVEWINRFCMAPDAEGPHDAGHKAAASA